MQLRAKCHGGDVEGNYADRVPGGEILHCIDRVPPCLKGGVVLIEFQEWSSYCCVRFDGPRDQWDASLLRRLDRRDGPRRIEWLEHDSVYPGRDQVLNGVRLHGRVLLPIYGLDRQAQFFGVGFDRCGVGKLIAVGAPNYLAYHETLNA